MVTVGGLPTRVEGWPTPGTRGCAQCYSYTTLFVLLYKIIKCGKLYDLFFHVLWRSWSIHSGNLLQEQSRAFSPPFPERVLLDIFKDRFHTSIEAQLHVDQFGSEWHTWGHTNLVSHTNRIASTRRPMTWHYTHRYSTHTCAILILHARTNKPHIYCAHLYIVSNNPWYARWTCFSIQARSCSEMGFPPFDNDTKFSLKNLFYRFVF